MNTLIKVSFFFIELIRGAKIAFYRNVHASMTGNAAFPNPPVTLAAFEAEIDAMEAKNNAVLAARTALLIAESELTQAEAALDQSGRAMANYVESACGNNPATLESSGFTLTAPRQPVGLMPAPTNLRAESTQVGTVLLRWGRDRGSLTFTAECATNPMGPWTEFYSGSRARCVATELTSGTQYWFRVQVMGSAGPSDWSDSISKRPL